ncbi:DUF3618 domain-containing protein [Lentzea aerocolonigenes]|uniref:DUF3618 domain-containing protein n=1 Tax=Lentzea aerocolonigenes TaxID=68170 RepID=UPI0004C46B59|nr:DUF3618 domain-containing protein [Lentzea aerocolonigenes]MCP2242552.1 Protein of unknown function (DUF3618) [Lentzea aerocolonigenes]
MSDPKEQLQRDVERTRRELGETVEALAHKVDVPGRVKEQAHETVVRMTAATNQAIESLPDPVAQQVEKARRHPGAVAAALIALVVAIWAISRRNR